MRVFCFMSWWVTVVHEFMSFFYVMVVHVHGGFNAMFMSCFMSCWFMSMRVFFFMSWWFMSMKVFFHVVCGGS